jgi:hypothetical protein
VSDYWIKYPVAFSYKNQIIFHPNSGTTYPFPTGEYNLSSRKELRMVGNRSPEWMIEITQVGNQFTASGPENVTIGDGNQLSHLRKLYNKFLHLFGIKE